MSHFAENDAPEVRVEWGIEWWFLPEPQPYPDERSARELVQAYIDNPDADGTPVAVSRVVTIGPWTRVFPPAERATGAVVPERQRCICPDGLCLDHCRACNHSGRDLEESCIGDPDWQPDEDDLARREGRVVPPAKDGAQ